jgi:hypothetical protein
MSYATVGQLRTYIVGAMAFLFVLLTFLQVLSVDKDRVRCETANAARVTELHQHESLVTVNVGRVLSASSPAEVQTNREALDMYRDNLVELIDSQRRVAVNPDVHIPTTAKLLKTLTAETPLEADPNAVIANCSETNPYPPPVSWFDQ